MKWSTVPISGIRTMENHSCVAELNAGVSTIMARFAGKPDSAMCPTYRVTTASKLFKKIGVENGWNKGENALLDFNGMHCVRHSSIAEAAAVGGLLAAQLRGAHDTPQMVRHYSNNNPQRVVNIKKKVERQQNRILLRGGEIRVRPLKSEVKHEARGESGESKCVTLAQGQQRHQRILLVSIEERNRRAGATDNGRRRETDEATQAAGATADAGLVKQAFVFRKK